MNLEAEISRTDLQGVETPASATITDAQQLSSYNYIDKVQDKLNIVVPGSPNLWLPPRAHGQLEKDTGLIYIDQHATRHPRYPLETLFRALYESQPAFDITSTDVITDRNNIRKLLNFVSYQKRENFTIFVEVINNTVLLGRHEPVTHQVAGANPFRGYGHSFEKEYIQPLIKGSTGHYRIISYNFAGMKMIVRHETDGYIDETDAPAERDENAEFDNYHDLSPAETASNNKEILVYKGGERIPLSSTLEIKTRVRHKEIAFEDVAPQLWASQTPKLVCAYHHKGNFSAPTVEDVSDKLLDWEKQKQEDLRKLAGLIVKIRELVRKQGGKAVLKYDDRSDRLGFWTPEGDARKMLPGDLYDRFER